MRVAILGTRGVPGNYGGFETFAEELGARLAARGHRVTVYCRSSGAGPRHGEHRGMRLVHLPAIRNKYVETLSHTLVSALHAAMQTYDLVYVCNSANAPICYIPWLRQQRTVLNVDGLEWERAKWGRTARAYYRWAARLAARMPIEIVTDARVIQRYYLEQMSRASRFFPYGTEMHERGELAERLSAIGLERDRYILYVSRLEPENNALLVVRAYGLVRTEFPLVIVGDAPYADGYIREVRNAADPRVLFLGYRFGNDYHALQSSAAIYIQATEVGGTHPALVEAMGHRNAILAHDVPEHREVLGDAGEYFARGDERDLARQLSRWLDEPSELERFRTLAGRRAKAAFSWDAVTDSYEAYFKELTGQ